MTNSDGMGELLPVESFERRLEAESVMALRGIIKMKPEVQEHLDPKMEKKLLERPNGQKLEVLTDPRSDILRKFNSADSFDAFQSSLKDVFGNDYEHVLEVAREDLDEYFETFSSPYRADQEEYKEILDHIENKIKPTTLNMLDRLSPKPVEQREFATTS